MRGHPPLPLSFGGHRRMPPPPPPTTAGVARTATFSHPGPLSPSPSSSPPLPQPSVTIFSAFDHLLLLKRGGQTVFFGPLGFECSNLIAYLQAIPGTPAIEPGDNPATWMLSEWLGVD